MSAVKSGLSVSIEQALQHLELAYQTAGYGEHLDHILLAIEELSGCLGIEPTLERCVICRKPAFAVYDELHQYCYACHATLEPQDVESEVQIP